MFDKLGSTEFIFLIYTKMNAKLYLKGSFISIATKTHRFLCWS